MPERQHDPEEIYRFIVAFKQAHDGNSPTLREIGAGCAISSTSVVVYHLGLLAKAGRIRLCREDRSRARRIEVVGGAWTLASGRADE